MGGETGVRHPAVTVNVEVPDIVTLVGLSVAVRPDGVLTVKLTVPLKPPWEVTVIMLVFERHWGTVIVLGLGMIVKSCTFTVTCVL